MSIPRKRYTTEFKLEVIALVVEQSLRRSCDRMPRDEAQYEPSWQLLGQCA